MYQATKYARAITENALTRTGIDSSPSVSICIRNHANGTRYHTESMISSFFSVKYLDESAMPQILIITSITKRTTVNTLLEKKLGATTVTSVYDRT